MPPSVDAPRCPVSGEHAPASPSLGSLGVEGPTRPNTETMRAGVVLATQMGALEAVEVPLP